jgi:hypothetical protein
MKVSTVKEIKLILICFFVVFSMIGIIGEAIAIDYYIATTGSDQNNCSIKLPCKTISYASTKLGAGDTLFVRGGTYYLDSAETVAVAATGSYGNPITIKNYTGETPIFDNGSGSGSLIQVLTVQNRYIIFDGLELQNATGGGISIENAQSITIKNCKFRNLEARSFGAINIRRLDGATSSNFLIENNIFTTIGRSSYITGGLDHSIYISKGTAEVIIRNNYFKNSMGGDAIHIYGGSSPRPHDVDIYNNIFYLTTGGNREAITAYAPSSTEIYNVQIYNNTIYLACSGATTCVGIDFRALSDVGNVAKNNIFYTLSGASVPLRTQGNKIFDYNLYYPSKDSDDDGAHSFVGDPLFVNMGTQDFYVSESSPVINRGVTFGAVTTDFDGITRPQGTAYDIGAYEFTGSTSVTSQYVNSSPVAVIKVNSITGYTVSITDTSTDNAAFPTNAITVNWGDRATSTGNNRATFSHTYTTAATFIITLTARDSEGLYKSALLNVTVPQKVSITAKLSPALTSSATFILKQSGITKATGTGTASYVFSNLNPGTYQVQMYKSGYTFDGNAGTTGSQNPLTVTVGPNKTVTFTHTP